MDSSEYAGAEQDSPKLSNSGETDATEFSSDDTNSKEPLEEGL
jgi:hypothetical protein